IQFIAIPENSGYQLVQLPPPNSSVIRLPLPNTPTTPTYILGKFTDECCFSNGASCRLRIKLNLAHWELCFYVSCQIFESSNEGKSRRCILLLGNAGMGKTTLIKKLCLDWSRDSFPQFDFVFLLDGKGLTLTEPVHSLQTLLLDLSSIAPCCVDPDEVYAQVLAAPKRVLLIFDGFDELRDYESLLQTQEKDCVTLLQKDSKMQTFTVRQLYSAILQRLLLPGCTLLLSSRPRGAGSQLLRRVDALLEVCGFTSDSIETYLTHYFTDPDLRASAFECLKSSSYLHHLCWNPALCRLACMVLEQGRSSEDLPRTLTELCHQVVCLKMEKHARGSTVCGSAQTQTSADSTQDNRSFLQALPFQTGAKCRRRPKKEELELTQRIVVGLLYHKKEKLQHLHSQTETVFRNTLTSRQGLAAKHLAGLSYSNLVPAQVLELCNYVYEASVSQESSKKGAGGTKLATQLAENLPESLRFNGVPFSPPDVFAMKDALRRGGAEGRNFCLDLENTGIQISGLRALMSLNNINSFRACIADVISLWEQLEQSGEEELLQGAVSKFHIHPLKATQVCHIAHLEKLVNIHMNKSSQLSHSILADGVPAVKDLHKLEFELGSEEGPLALPKLWDLLPGLHNLQHLDLEESKIEDEGADKLAMVLDSLTSLEVLNLSQNCIGDHGVKKLALALKDLPKLHCLSLYSNEISDEGAESLAATHVFVWDQQQQIAMKYKPGLSLNFDFFFVSYLDRMWNQCIPYGVFERLQRQDSRIL
uniref:Class II, major histocompatibility complex, transactivator n=1 Tax=Oryzias melastigma TaxID=30732 RepID=A0A3B3CMI5_ORYME